MKILDICCGHGLAAIGYKQIFPHSRIVGIDTKDMSAVYPFEFVQGDGFSVDYDFISRFDLIHMSPPCQRYSKVTPKKYRDNHPHLIPNALRLGYASGKPFVVENVPGSTQYLRPTCKLSVGGRERYFHTSFPVSNREWVSPNIMSSSYSSKTAVFDAWGVPGSYNLGMRDIR